MNIVVLLAGGLGTRAKQGRPKQFVEINGRPVGERGVCSLPYEVKLGIRAFLGRHSPEFLKDFLKKIYRATGEVYIQIIANRGGYA